MQKVAAARYLWTNKQARPSQLAPDGDWNTWLFLAGRGAGKTRTAAEELVYRALKQDNTRWAIVAPTFGDARDICVEGDSGILSIARRYGVLAPKNGWNRSMGEVRLTNGSFIKLFSAEEPDRLRGPQHHGAWCDELASFKYPEAFDQLQFGLRLGASPQVIITTTPRPTKQIKDLLSRQDGSVAITRGSTFDNAANLAPKFLAELMARYEGTRLGRQEMYGEVLDDVEGALWSRDMIEQTRVKDMPQMARVVVAIDPATTNKAESDETGIVVAGRSNQGEYFMLADYTLKASPLEWAQRAVEAYDLHDADAIVVEVNNGGDMIRTILRQIRPELPIIEVRATRGKQLRAEPIAALYEQGRVHHVGMFDELETQMCEWTPDEPYSPDRLDALVWAMTELSVGSHMTSYLSALAVWCPNCNLPMPKSAKHCHKCNEPLAEMENVDGSA